MNNPYDIHSWSTQYRQERLAEARMTQLDGQLREDRKARSGQSSLAPALANVRSLVRGA
jgi:hypothetical protein